MKVEWDIKKLEAAMWRLNPKRIKGAIKEATFAVAQSVKIQEQQGIRKHIDRPKPWTVSSMFIKKTNGTTPDASVEWKQQGTSAGHYLLPQVHGGTREQKPFEKRLEGMGAMPQGWVAIPTKDAPRDGYGNVPGATIKAILKDILTGGKRTLKSGKQKDKKKTYFANIIPTPGFAPGIYQRVGMGLGDAIRPIFIFVRSAKYKKRLPFFEIGHETSKKIFSSELSKAMNKKENHQ